MSLPCRATVCILTYGDYLPYFRRCLDSVLANTPAEAMELRLGFNAAPISCHYALGQICPDGTTPKRHLLPEGIERLTCRGVDGLTVRLWNSPVNLYKEPLSRLMYYDAALATEYAIWFDDDSFVSPGWWEELVPLLDRKIDCIGQEWWVDYLPGQLDMIRSQPWYRGMAFEKRRERAGVRFMTGGFMAVRAERLREANFPDVRFRWKGDALKQYGGDTLLGEIARQLGWSREAHHKHIQVNVDLQGNHPAPRRGGTGRQFGSDVNIVIK